MLNATKKPVLWYGDNFPKEYVEDIENAQFSINLSPPSKCGSCIYLQRTNDFNKKYYCSNIHSVRFNLLTTKNTKNCKYGSR